MREVGSKKSAGSRSLHACRLLLFVPPRISDRRNRFIVQTAKYLYIHICVIQELYNYLIKMRVTYWLSRFSLPYHNESHNYYNDNYDENCQYYPHDCTSTQARRITCTYFWFPYIKKITKSMLQTPKNTPTIL